MKYLTDKEVRIALYDMVDLLLLLSRREHLENVGAYERVVDLQRKLFLDDETYRLIRKDYKFDDNVSIDSPPDNQRCKNCCKPWDGQGK